MHGLQLCDYNVAGSVQCAPAGYCAGANNSNCYGGVIWSDYFSGSSYYYAYLKSGSFGLEPGPITYAFSVRCLLIKCDGVAVRVLFTARF